MKQININNLQIEVYQKEDNLPDVQHLLHKQNLLRRVF